MNKSYRIHNMDTGADWTFQAWTAYEAMQKLLYSLNLSHRDDSAAINKTESGTLLYTEHNGQTWCVLNNR